MISDGVGLGVKNFDTPVMFMRRTYVPAFITIEPPKRYVAQFLLVQSLSYLVVQLEFDYNQKGQKGMPKRIELGWIVRNGVDSKL